MVEIQLQLNQNFTLKISFQKYKTEEKYTLNTRPVWDNVDIDTAGEKVTFSPPCSWWRLESLFKSEQLYYGEHTDVYLIF